MESKKNIVVCLSRFPYPLEKGDKLRAFYQLRSLSEKFDVTLICTTDNEVSPADYDKVKVFCKSIHVFQLTKLGLLFTLITHLFSKKPFQVQYFYRFSIHRKIDRILDEVHPDFIFCQLIRTTEYVKNYHSCPKTLDYMDALSKGMERRIATEPFYKSWFYKMETRRLKQYERSVFDYFEHQTIISNQDKQYITHPKRDKIVVVPNGVSESFFVPLNIEKKYDLIFTGNFSYAPNINAALFIARQLLPELAKHHYFPTVLLAGASPSSEVKSIQNNQITVTGWVEDIRESYQSARLFIAPLFIGTGLQNKLLEAMASGLPCITTSLVNNALGAKNGQNILLADNLDEFVEKIIKYKSELDTFSEITNNGTDFVEKNYSWETQNEKLLSLLH